MTTDQGDPLRALIAKWRGEAERHQKHGDCYRRGQGWGLTQAADELDAVRASLGSSPQPPQDDYGEGNRRFFAGERINVSTGICGSLTYGYGALDKNGYWQFPVHPKLAMLLELQFGAGGSSPQPPQDVTCEHGTALDVHCCNCHSGFIFDINHECPEPDHPLREIAVLAMTACSNPHLSAEEYRRALRNVTTFALKKLEAGGSSPHQDTGTADEKARR